MKRLRDTARLESIFVPENTGNGTANKVALQSEQAGGYFYGTLLPVADPSKAKGA